MPASPRLQFARVSKPAGGVAIVFVDAKLSAGPQTGAFLGLGQALLRRAAEAEGFKGKQGATLDIVAPHGLALDRLVVIGLGEGKDLKPRDLLKLGGIAAGKIPASAKSAAVILEKPGVDFAAEDVAQVALGLKLRLYRFDRYKTKRKEDDEDKSPATLVSLSVAAEAPARKAWRAAEAVGEGVSLARDLVNEPPNVLYPAEFARRATALRKLGVDVRVFDDKAMAKLGMNALLGVGQGSQHESRMVILRWNGGRATDKPLAIVGKGVTFDTGGISIKPAGSMEDMKGDMAGAACVLGLMHALAARKAKANVIGAIGLVENMPDGNAQRPGDIVTSMSGQTIEIINTDAEGRLVLGDVLWYVNKKLKPAAMIDLATLTGAIMVALGHEYAGLFTNDDALAAKLSAAGEETGERVWRLPLGPEYDKLIDSKFADMKNTGGRNAGSITAAQFLQRFVDGTPWAHLDIAGTGFGAGSTDVNRSWGPGWGVRLLDRLIAEHHER